ncbi:MAG TPA: HNH endonuclease signature motif containing protein [Longimicrobium sp.]|jgi:5-methylcytosine-specific restriction protein A
MIWIFTGDQGEQYGYEDGFRDDGTYWYTGEGQVGDMKMIRGNWAIQNHVQLSKSLHLFESTQPGYVRYVGEMQYLDDHEQVAADREGNPRRTIVFELAPVSSEEGTAAADIVVDRVGRGLPKTKSLEELRRIALESASAGATPQQRKANAYRRSQAVRAYVLRRAAGYCEGCGFEAPFRTPTGSPYLEPHHIRRRADGGPDHPRWVVALCPNCHRRVHFSNGGATYNEQLAEKVIALEENSSHAR